MVGDTYVRKQANAYYLQSGDILSHRAFEIHEACGKLERAS